MTDPSLPPPAGSGADAGQSAAPAQGRDHEVTPTAPGRHPASTPTAPGSDHEITPPPAVIHHFLVQAPVEPLDVDGLKLVTIGIAAFAVASATTWVMRADLARAGNGWWFGVCVSGLALGLVGLAYCLVRRDRRRAGHWDRD